MLSWSPEPHTRLGYLSSIDLNDPHSDPFTHRGYANPADLVTESDSPETKYFVLVLFFDSMQNEDLRSLVVLQVISIPFFLV